MKITYRDSKGRFAKEDPWVARLRAVCKQFDNMEPREIDIAVTFLIDKYQTCRKDVA